jgi:hypothetical protein
MVIGKDEFLTKKEKRKTKYFSMMKMKAGTYTNTTTTRELGGLAKTKPNQTKRHSQSNQQHHETQTEIIGIQRNPKNRSSRSMFHSPTQIHSFYHHPFSFILFFSPSLPQQKRRNQCHIS